MATQTDVVAITQVTHTDNEDNEEKMEGNIHPVFASLNADIALCSKDNTTFRIHSHILIVASGWFRTMFTLPQGTACTSEALQMEEDADVLAGLLTIVSGVDLPVLNNIDYLESLLRAAEKYDMPLPTAIVRLAIMSPVMEASPIRVYGIACRMGWIPEAKLASTRTLTLDLFAPEAVAELNRLEAPHLTKLLALHRQRRDRFIAGMDDDSSSPIACPACATPAAARREYMDMEELATVLGARCSHKECQKMHYDRALTMRNIVRIVEELPRCVEFPD
ncbi:hypothetical protein A0H81_00719 [Grifola frondosa]|uniref:BTB domain-containing protein n=1 Tax=Grifola frondosa TaxID=5627 RepID=A0A1C7MQU9_GRIFR|nr:hypothetical protein A0H81_00719 [Grifola frondosa]